jgi:elongation factor 1-alpha
MITGASQADAAILLMSGKLGEFETGIADTGQTREHAFLAKTLGIKQVIVAVNKMDDESVGFKESRFKEVVEKGGELLKLVGYKMETDVKFIPVSAYHGDNLIASSANMPWFKGPPLLTAIDQLVVPDKPTEKSLRLPVQDVYKIKGAGVVPVGRVETGILKVGQNVNVAPGGFVGEVRSIEMHHEAMQEAGPGDNVGLNIRGITMKDIKRGDVIAPKDDPCNVVSPTGSMQINGIVIWHPTSITIGYTPVVHSHTAQIACKFIELHKAIDQKTKQTEENPKFLKKGQAAVFTIQPIKKFPLEAYNKFAELGRIAVRDMGRTCVVGVVLKTTN